ncbi:MAG: hypothetical protein NC489_30115 [Ruminococcus flavefaciens]|nr:hypothetical protein [Ruminococcus flavefaciens]
MLGIFQTRPGNGSNGTSFGFSGPASRLFNFNSSFSMAFPFLESSAQLLQKALGLSVVGGVHIHLMNQLLAVGAVLPAFTQMLRPMTKDGTVSLPLADDQETYAVGGEKTEAGEIGYA